MRTFLSYIYFITIAVMFSTQVHAAFKMPDLARTCLPEEGRMSRDMKSACHCPPQSMCPEDLAEWNENTDRGVDGLMPQRHANICCDPPEQCNFFTTSTQGNCFGVGGPAVGGNQLNNGLNIQEVNFCREWEAIKKEEPKETCKTYNLMVELHHTATYSEWHIKNRCIGLTRMTLSEFEKRFPQYAQGNPYAIRCDGCDGGGEDSSCANSGFTQEFCDKPSAADKKDIEKINQDRQKIAADATKCADQCIRQHGPADRMSTQRWNAMTGCLNSCRPSDSGVKCVRNYTLNRCTQVICRQDNDDNDSFDCLSPNAGIVMADGSVKKLHLIVPGDQVKGDHATNIVQEVLRKEWEQVTMYSINNGALELTVDHPIMTEGGWKAIDYRANYDAAKSFYGLSNVGTLEVGDVILGNETPIEVETIQSLPTRTHYTTYNLRLDGSKSFFANGILVRSN